MEGGSGQAEDAVGADSRAERLPRWIRALTAVVTGYLFSQGINTVFVYAVYLTDAAPPLTVMVPATLFGFALVGALTGPLTAKIAGPAGARSVQVLAALIAFVTVGNILVDVAAEPLWHKLVVLLVMAPAVLWSGVRATRRSSR